MAHQLSGKQLILFVFISMFFTFGSLVMSVVEGNDKGKEILVYTPTFEHTAFPSHKIEQTAAQTIEPTFTLIPTLFDLCDFPVSWKSYTMEFGDSLSGLEKLLLVSEEKIIEGNCLKIPFLVEGDVIYLPAKSTLTPTIINTESVILGTTDVFPSSEIICGAPDGWKTYQIKEGDTLFGVSKAFGIKISEMQFANCMGEDTYIITGVYINVPNVSPNFPTPNR